MILKYIENKYQKDWEDLTKANPASGYMQSFFWTELQNLLGWETFKIGFFEKDKLLGGAIVAKYSHFKNRSILCIPEGPVLPYGQPEAEEMFQKLIGEIDKIANLTGEKLTSHLSIEPKLTQVPIYFSRFKKAPVDQQPLRTLLIDLKLSEDQILQQMKPKGRYNIRVAKKHKVEIVSKSIQNGLKDFLVLYQEFTKRSGFEGKDDSYFESLAYVLPRSESADFYFAKYNGQILATALVIYYGNTATFLFGASSDKNRNLMSSSLLHFEIIKKAKQKGFKWYDFYGLAPGIETESHPWYGFSVFKKKFGGKQVDYIGAHDFIYNQKLYEEYLKENK